MHHWIDYGFVFLRFRNLIGILKGAQIYLILFARVSRVPRDRTRCKDAINLSFTPFFTPLVTPNVTPWLAILPNLVSVVNATFVMHKTTVYKQKYAA